MKHFKSKTMWKIVRIQDSIGYSDDTLFSDSDRAIKNAPTPSFIKKVEILELK